MPRTDHRTRPLRNILKDIKEKNLKIAAPFQRGDDETGVWSSQMKKNYIDSYMNGFPYGTLTIVQRANMTNNEWMILDGANKTRSLRDFVNNKFKTIEGKKFNELSEIEQARFLEKGIPICEVTVDTDEKAHIIGDMFCRLNTQVKKLSNGELIKALGWLGDILPIEWGKWMLGEEPNNFKTILNNDEQYSKYITIKNTWIKTCGGKLSLDKRYNNVARLAALNISGEKSNSNLNNSNYKKLKVEMSRDCTLYNHNNVYKTFQKLFEITSLMEKETLTKIFKGSNGIPNNLQFSPLWTICADNKEISHIDIAYFYNYITNDIKTFGEFKQVLQKGGDSHSTITKVQNAITFISDFTNRKLLEKD